MKNLKFLYHDQLMKLYLKLHALPMCEPFIIETDEPTNEPSSIFTSFDIVDDGWMIVGN